jgi:hypothetical protein
MEIKFHIRRGRGSLAPQVTVEISRDLQLVRAIQQILEKYSKENRLEMW